jgi:TrmH family RNA methyltransferase
MPREIHSFANETVKRIRSLREKKERRAEGKFLAEGLRILAEARDSGQLPMVIAHSPAGGVHPLAAEIIAAAEAEGADVIETTPDILSKMSGKDNPQAILGVYRQPPTDLASIERDRAPLWLVAQALRDPGNIGTMLRTGDAVGAGGLILVDDCADAFSVEAVRASMGAIFTVPVKRVKAVDELPAPRVALVAHAGEELTGPAGTLLVGAEREGLDDDVVAACDRVAHIPIEGDSLNAAMAATVALDRVARRA